MMPQAINPKDAIGLTKPGLRHLPAGPQYAIAQALDNGAAKYGAYNWRAAPVLASTYHDACKRHLDSWFGGSDLDAESGLPHLAHAGACLQILLDAVQQGCLKDDRPAARVSLEDILSAMSGGAAVVKRNAYNAAVLAALGLAWAARSGEATAERARLAAKDARAALEAEDPIRGIVEGIEADLIQLLRNPQDLFCRGTELLRAIERSTWADCDGRADIYG